MIPDPVSRHGLMQDEQHEYSSGRAPRRSSGRKWLRRAGYALVLSLILFMDVLSNMSVAAAASHAPTKLPIPQANYTLQQFLKQGHPYHPKDAPLVSSPANHHPIKSLPFTLLPKLCNVPIAS